VSGETFRRCLELLAADRDVDAIIAVIMPTGATGDLVTAVQEANVGVPIAVVLLNQVEPVRLLPRRAISPDTTDAGTGGAQPDSVGRLPAYDYPEAAAKAVARAARYGVWRAEPLGRTPAFLDLRTGAARTLVRHFARHAPGAGGWLLPDQTTELLRCYGISLARLAPLIGGTEVTVAMTDDHMFGPNPDPDHGEWLAPLTDADADKLIHSIGSTTSPLGDAGAPDVGVGALRDVLLRVSRLVEDLAGITDLELNLVITRAAAVVAVDARIKLAPHEPHDPFLRRSR
jgi:acyl-CoA synthetase (NDP forming)